MTLTVDHINSYFETSGSTLKIGRIKIHRRSAAGAIFHQHIHAQAIRTILNNNSKLWSYGGSDPSVGKMKLLNMKTEKLP